VRRMRAGLAALGHLVANKRVHRLRRPLACADATREPGSGPPLAVTGRFSPGLSDCQCTSSPFDSYCAGNKVRRPSKGLGSATIRRYLNRSS